jgi:hypothetical protein
MLFNTPIAQPSDSGSLLEEMNHTLLTELLKKLAKELNERRTKQSK